ncbi:CAP domain-containing protein [Nocardioides sp. MAHUQ-72]|uniref:CAP domain-containing protein n=1 Tax=unclassified Nocardioides TaxID=2615069 RepID=UPI00361A7385
MVTRTSLAATLVALATALTLAPPAQAATAASYSAAAVKATNHQRAEHDRVHLKHSDCLQQFARRQAKRMARQERIYHQDLGVILEECRLSITGENVAVGFPTGKAVVNQGWMRSPDHRANILERRYRRIAVAARRGDDGRWYVSQVFGRRA